MQLNFNVYYNIIFIYICLLSKINTEDLEQEIQRVHPIVEQGEDPR
jgi:hypothetical protein